jgi:hypothetical protein
MATRLEAYRARAAECTIIAANSTDTKMQMTFTELAAQWRLLADRTETRCHEQAHEHDEPLNAPPFSSERGSPDREGTWVKS